MTCFGLTSISLSTSSPAFAWVRLCEQCSARICTRTTLRYKLHHNAPHCSALHHASHPSDWLWTCLDVIKTIQSGQPGCSVRHSHSILGAICLVVGDHWTELLILRRHFKQGCRQGYRGPGSMGVTAGWEGRGWSLLLPGVVQAESRAEL